MKSIIILIVTLLGFLFEGQSQNELSFYIPLNTYHFNRDQVDKGHYTENEGGDIGIVVQLRRDRGRVFSASSIGVVRNSYGDVSVLALVGIGRDIGILTTDVSVGLATGYERFYELDDTTIFPSLFSDNGLLPYAAVTLSL